MKKVLLFVLITIFLIALWVLQIARLKAYNECYMAKYSDWNTDCELGN